MKTFLQWSAALELCCLRHVHPTNEEVAVTLHTNSALVSVTIDKWRLYVSKQSHDSSTITLREKVRGKAHPITLRDGLGQHSATEGNLC